MGRIVTTSGPSFGERLRSWRELRGMSQLQLASAANISSRHLSFLETGRSQPSREMLARLATQLGVPQNDRDALLLAAGFAPTSLRPTLPDDDLTPDQYRQLRDILAGHEPMPAFAMDARWNLIDANAGMALLFDHARPGQLRPPVNMLRFTLHRDGLAPRIINLPKWRASILGQLRRRVMTTGDPFLTDLYDELLWDGDPVSGDLASVDVGLPLRLARDGRELSLISTVMTFGMPGTDQLCGIVLKLFLPADRETAEVLYSSSVTT